MKISLVSVKMNLCVNCLAGLILSFTISGAVFGQTQPQRPGTTPPPKTGSGSGSGSTDRPRGDTDRSSVVRIDDGESDYRLAARDVIEVIVEDAPELSTNYTIGGSGVVPLRYLGNTKISDMTTDEVATLITEKLRGRYLKDPKVYVSVKQYNSRTFFIQGAVRQPGSYVISGKPTLFKLMTIAGGLQENHGGTAYIFREAKPKAEKLESGELSDTQKRLKQLVDNAKGNDPAAEVVGEPDYEVVTANIAGILRGRLDNNIIVQPSDVVYVPPADVFYISGEVKQPGMFQIRQGITLRQAISLAGGPLFKAKLGSGIIFRVDPVTGNFTEMPVDIGAVQSGKQPDIPILGNDVIWVPNSTLKALGATVVNTVIPTAILRIPLGR
ncbi:MAG TPA: polysaccharide biosynthesis/export family protein [Blastocatellia bacterium]|nr:polysaccharide biosynthesis/export family protein [Blastocatellia bacterium]